MVGWFGVINDKGRGKNRPCCALRRATSLINLGEAGKEPIFESVTSRIGKKKITLRHSVVTDTIPLELRTVSDNLLPEFSRSSKEIINSY
jgi:hypothetical protein